MELMKEQDALEHQCGEVTFLVKPLASSYDRLQVVMAQTPTEFLEAAIKQMVIGWKGVTRDSKPVPYSYDVLKLLPDSNGDVLLGLGRFILDKTDVRGGKVKNA